MAGDVSEPKGIVQRALAGHAAIGLLAGGLLYLICLSGMLAVSHERWQRWEEPGAVETPSIAPAAIQAALAGTIARQGKPTEHAYVHLPTDSLPRVVVTTDHGADYVDAEGNPDQPEAHAWTEFMLFLHIYLHLPPVLGLLVVGGLGAMLAALAATGVAAHPRIFRDAFRMRLRGGGQLARADLHNRLGVWLLPFTLALAFTGAAIGLGQIVFLSVASERYGGNLDAVYAPLFGAHPEADAAPAPLARADRAVAWMAEHHPEHRITYVTLEDPMTAGQQIEILADHDRRLIYGETYRFDGDGTFLGAVGLSDGPAGRQAVASVYKLHFGSFGGVFVEIAYLVFGLALCAITATGMTIWLMKRRARGLASPRLESFWEFVVWGSPLALVLAYWLRAAAGAGAPLTSFFWGLLCLGIVATLVRPDARTGPVLRNMLGVAMLLTGAVHALVAPALPASSAIIDLTLAVFGAVLAAPLLARALPRPLVRNGARLAAIRRK